MNTQVQWKARPRTEVTEVARRRIWESRCGQYRVVNSRSLYGLPDVFYAMRRMGPSSWAIIRRHRKRRPAFLSCERDRS
jgi:hypothetical protein